MKRLSIVSVPNVDVLPLVNRTLSHTSFPDSAILALVALPIYTFLASGIIQVMLSKEPEM
jgi:hypothetical protein